LKYVIAFAVAYTAILVGYRGEFFAFPIYIITFGVIAAGVALLPRFRAFTLPSVLLLAFTTPLVLFGWAVMRGPIHWWPIRQLGVTSFVWLPALIISVVAEALVPADKVRLLRPASAVAGAVFMAFVSWGNDTTTPYDRMLPRFLVAMAIAFSPLIPIRRFPFVAAYAYAIVEPILIILLGWAASRTWSLDLQWLLPYFAAPPAAAALLLGWRSASPRFAVT